MSSPSERSYGANRRNPSALLRPPRQSQIVNGGNSINSSNLTPGTCDTNNSVGVSIDPNPNLRYGYDMIWGEGTRGVGNNVGWQAVTPVSILSITSGDHQNYPHQSSQNPHYFNMFANMNPEQSSLDSANTIPDNIPMVCTALQNCPGQCQTWKDTRAPVANAPVVSLDPMLTTFGETPTTSHNQISWSHACAAAVCTPANAFVPHGRIPGGVVRPRPSIAWQTSDLLPSSLAGTSGRPVATLGTDNTCILNNSSQLANYQEGVVQYQAGSMASSARGFTQPTAVGHSTYAQRPPVASGPGQIQTNRTHAVKHGSTYARGNACGMGTLIRGGSIAKPTGPARPALPRYSQFAASETRDHAACIRCQRNRKKCKMSDDPTGMCTHCREALTLRIPCIRSHITDSILFRTGTSDNDTWTKRPEIPHLRDLSNYVSPYVRFLELTHGVPNAGSISVLVREFKPIDGDVTSYDWTDKNGRSRTMKMPHYALSGLHETKESFGRYIEKNIQRYLQAHLKPLDPVVQTIFKLALRRANNNPNSLLRECLRLWTAARLIEEPWQISGQETLNIPRVDDPDHIFYERIPVTPVMDTQLDRIAIGAILDPLRRNVLRSIQTKISKPKKADWFDVFGSFFIFLNTIELAVRHDHEFARTFGHKTPGRGSRFEDYNLVEGYFHSAQCVIAHFREAFHGQVPFTESCSMDKIAQLAGIDEEESQALRDLKGHLERNEGEYRKLKTNHQYESPMYWSHQLFYDEWDGNPVHIVEKKCAI